MGSSYKISNLYRSKYKVKNGEELEVIDFTDIIDLGKKFYPIAKYFINKYSFNENKYDLLELKKEDLETFLNIVKTKSIFKYCDKNEWFKSYGNYYYDEEIKEFHPFQIRVDREYYCFEEVEENQYYIKKYKKKFTKEEIIDLFLEDLIKEISELEKINLEQKFYFRIL